MFYHHVFRSRREHLLFQDAEEAFALWRSFTRGFPEAAALCLMPDHGHALLPHADPEGRMHRVMSGFARWKAHHRGISTPLWDVHPPAERIPDEKHLRRVVRYVHLNPCRAHLVSDPLAWPWSTHRDRVGFAVPAFGPLEANPASFHRYVSADPTCDVNGTELPRARYDEFRLVQVMDAVASLCRLPRAALTRRGAARRLAVRTCWVHGIRDRAALMQAFALSRHALYELIRDEPGRGALGDDRALAAAVRVVGDPRFDGLPELWTLPGWGRYRLRSVPMADRFPTRLR